MQIHGIHTTEKWAKKLEFLNIKCTLFYKPHKLSQQFQHWISWLFQFIMQYWWNMLQKMETWCYNNKQLFGNINPRIIPADTFCIGTDEDFRPCRPSGMISSCPRCLWTVLAAVSSGAPELTKLWAKSVNQLCQLLWGNFLACLGDPDLPGS